ncbi:MAG: hypothetical protein ACXABY_19905, partial [Candidatus Thorarchaeota archaeon]
MPTDLDRLLRRTKNYVNRRGDYGHDDDSDWGWDWPDEHGQSIPEPEPELPAVPTNINEGKKKVSKTDTFR